MTISWLGRRPQWRRNPSRRSRPAAARRTPWRAAVEVLEDRCLLSGSAIAPPQAYAPYTMPDVGGKLLFVAQDPGGSLDLWGSDGTAAGTSLVKSFGRDQTSLASDWALLNGTLYFFVTDAYTQVTVTPPVGAPMTMTGQEELWRSDGTSAGTVMVTAIDPSANGQLNDYGLTNARGTLFFAANDGTDGEQLWKSDGTAVGTVMVTDTDPGHGFDGIPSHLIDRSGTLFFAADDAVNGNSLWKTDGTAAGTLMVAQVNPYSGGNAIFDLVNVNGTLFFQAGALWKSDGTAAGTSIVANFLNTPEFLTNANGTLFFSADDGTHGAQLWKSDGSALGTVMVTSAEAQHGGIDPQLLTNVGGILFFTASDATHGRELWTSDGSAAGTAMVADINKGTADSNPWGLTAVNGTAFFTANDGSDGFQLWRSNGSAAGTVMVKDINASGDAMRPNAVDLTNANGTLMFVANDGVHGRQLWRSDGTVAGTVSIGDLNFGSGWGPDATSQVTAMPWPGSNSPVNTGTISAASAGAVFVVASGSQLFLHTDSGWSKLGDGIVSVSAVSAAGDTVAFAVTADHALFRYSVSSGWRMVGAQGTIASVSAGLDASGRADSYVLTTDGSFTAWSDSSGWLASPVGGRGSILSMDAADGGRVAAVTADHSVFEYDPHIGWFRLTVAGFAAAAQVSTESSGNEVLYVQTTAGGLYRHDFNVGWSAIGAAGTIERVSAGTDAAGRADVVVVTTSASVAENDSGSGWLNLNAPGAVSKGAVAPCRKNMSKRGQFLGGGPSSWLRIAQEVL